MATAVPLAAHVVHVPDPLHLRDELAGFADRPRPEVVAGVKALRLRELAAIARTQIEHSNELTGLDTALAISGMTDAVVRALAHRAFLRAGAPGDWYGQVGVFAIGGYGRGEMNPNSDLDLLVFALDRPCPWLDKGWAELQTLLWDVKFQVGASKRGAAELARIIDDDYVTATAVIEGRSILATQAVDARFLEMLARFRDRRSLPFLRFKLEELAKRREAAGASPFLMEPNLKSNPGCLRDVQLLRNLGFCVSGSRNLYHLEELEVITRADLTGVVAANDHLLMLRSLLHFHHGRKHDTFQLADQVRIAKQLGYADVSRLSAVEHFMKLHYAKVLHVHQIVDLALSRARAKGHLGRRPILIKTRRKLDEDFVAVDGQVYPSHDAWWQKPDWVRRIFSVCRLAQDRKLTLSLEFQRQIRHHLDRVTDEVRHDAATAQAFLAVIGNLGQVRPILTDLHRAGLLGAYLPEFGVLTCHMQFDSYHQYTVDEHTLIALGNLDAVASGRVQGAPGMTRILPHVQRKDLLALSLLLHDMGKYMGRGHVARGAMMAVGVGERLHLEKDAADFMYFLVERHVILSDASRMRDFHQPSFLGPFAQKIGDRARLDALYCLTWCDAKAVGEGILTGWQEAILGELYEAVAAELSSSGAHRAIAVEDRLAQELVVAKVASAEAQEFIRSLSGTYPHQVVAGEIVRHWRVHAEAKRDGIGLDPDFRDSHVHLVAAAPDRHALFADVTATLCGHGFDVIDARTWVTANAMVIYSFRLASIFPAKLREEATWAALKRDLIAVVGGKLDARTLLERRRKTYTDKPADSGFDDPAVKLEGVTSDTHTIVDVHTKDEVGLLSRLCREISDAGIEIGHACINTMGDVAVDVFYVQRQGRKLDEVEAEDLRGRVIRMLNLKTA